MMIWKNQSKMKSMNNGEEEEEEKETTLERTSSNPLLILSVGKVFPHQFLRQWHACIFKAKKKTYLHIRRATRRFLNDEGGHIMALEIDYLEQNLGVTDNVLEQGQEDIGILAIKDKICGTLQMCPLQRRRWECPKYNETRSLFEKVTKDDREQLYNHFVCSMLTEINSR